jgi:hypothetical protein
MSEDWAAFWIGVIAGCLLLGILLTFVPGPFKHATEAIEQCEKSLPRDQHCKVIAVPQTGSEP